MTIAELLQAIQMCGGQVQLKLLLKNMSTPLSYSQPHQKRPQALAPQHSYLTYICGSPGQKSNIILLRISTTLPRSKRCSTVLPLRVGLICTMQTLTHMWQSRVEIERYSVAYFNHVTAFKALSHISSVKGRAHACYIDLTGIHASLLHV